MAPLRCCNPRCPNQGRTNMLLCSQCKALGLPREVAAYCSRDCFRADWNNHKRVHDNPPTPTMPPDDSKMKVSSPGRIAEPFAKMKIGGEIGEQYMKMQVRLKELGVEVRDLGRNNGGRSLFARRHFSPGEVIINDRSIIRSFKPETTDYHYEASVVDIVRRLFLIESKARFTEVICQWLTLIPAVEIVESKDMPFKMRCTLNFNTIALIEEIKKTEAGKERLEQVKRLTSQSDPVLAIQCLILTAKQNAITIYDYCENKLADGVSPLTSYINHSCFPNITLAIVEEEDGTWSGQCRAITEISEGEEFHTTYIGLYRYVEDRREDLYMNYHFMCECQRCSDPNNSPSELDRIPQYIAPCQNPYSKDKQMREKLDAALQIKEQEVEEALKGEPGVLFPTSIALLKSWMEEALSFYSPLHKLIYRARESLGCLYLYAEMFQEATIEFEALRDMAERVYPENWHPKAYILKLLWLAYVPVDRTKSQEYREIHIRMCKILAGADDIVDRGNYVFAIMQRIHGIRDRLKSSRRKKGGRGRGGGRRV